MPARAGARDAIENTDVRFGIPHGVHSARRAGCGNDAPAGDSTGGPDNTHRGADQWLLVVDGRGEALLGHDQDNRERVPLEPGTLLVIERGEAHEIRNTGDAPLKTLNVYYPPAFDEDGEPVGPGESG